MAGHNVNITTMRSDFGIQSKGFKWAFLCTGPRSHYTKCKTRGRFL